MPTLSSHIFGFMAYVLKKWQQFMNTFKHFSRLYSKRNLSVSGQMCRSQKSRFFDSIQNISSLDNKSLKSGCYQQTKNWLRR